MAKYRITEVTCDFCHALIGHYERDIVKNCKADGAIATDQFQFCNPEHRLAYLRQKQTDFKHNQHLESTLPPKRRKSTQK